MDRSSPVRRYKIMIGAKKKHRLTLLLYSLPFVIFVFMFSYVPIYGWIYAFFKYRPGLTLEQMEFTGLRYFALALSGGSRVLNALKNTVALSSLSLLTSPLPMIFAIFLNEVRFRRISKLTQTISTLPNFFSWVTIYAVFFAVFAPGEGLLNLFLSKVINLQEPTNILVNDDWAWVFQTAISTYKGIGYSAIIYLAAINGIDTELYDAADVDGANRWQKIKCITIPFLLQTYFVLLIIGIGYFLNTGFDQYYVFSNPFVAIKLDVLDTYTYRVGLLQNNYSLGTAVGMMKSLVSIVLLFLANSIAKWVRGNSVF